MNTLNHTPNRTPNRRQPDTNRREVQPDCSSRADRPVQPEHLEQPRRTPKTQLCSRPAQTFSVLAVTAVFLVFFVWGLLFFLRPSSSETEKRELTPFPALNWDDLISGEWTRQISLWYADTFPGRDGLISTWHRVESLYGVRNEKFQGSVGDEVPDETMGDPTVVESDRHVQGDPDWEKVNGYYLAGDTAYELYYFDKANAARYAALINRAADSLAGKATVYDLIIPLHYTFALSEDIQASLGVADGTKTVRYLYSGMNERVMTVDVTPYLAAHRDEYLYFRTDHHWTATGAYYAYTAFCETAGLTPTPLSSFEKLSFGGFLGTLYAKTEEPAALRDNPDTVEAYVPIGTNDMTVLMQDGKEYTFPVIQRRTDTYYAAAASKYNCFIAGDNPLSTIHNVNIAANRRGTAVVLIKESYGNAFAPFLVDSFEYVYIIDYRYYDGNLTDFVTTHGVNTVIFLNNLVATTAGARLSEMEALIG